MVSEWVQESHVKSCALTERVIVLQKQRADALVMGEWDLGNGS